jgi:hypothetical protein
MPSNQEHFPSIAIFAQIGPITHNTKAENDPRKAIIVENSGMIIETATTSKARQVRSKTRRMGLVVVCGEVAKTVADLLVGDGGLDGVVG